MSRADWSKHVAQQERSGKSIAEYCREYGMSEKSFHYQRKKRLGKFVQVSGREPIEVALPEGAVLRVPSSQIGVVLKALRESRDA